MKKFVNIWTGLVIALLFFSLVSGCKLVHKLTSKSKGNSELKTSDQQDITISKADSSNFLKVDTSKKIVKTTTKSSNKKITEITIELDSNRIVSADTSNKDPMDRLIDAALKRASKIKIRVEQEQHKNKQQEETTSNHKSESGSGAKKENTVMKSKNESEQKSAFKKSDTDIKRDGTVATNLGWLWWLLVIPCLVAGYLIYRRFK